MGFLKIKERRNRVREEVLSFSVKSEKFSKMGFIPNFHESESKKVLRISVLQANVKAR
jgi:hypothetical protein